VSANIDGRLYLWHFGQAHALAQFDTEHSVRALAARRPAPLRS
jgi:hypothetical protein